MWEEKLNRNVEKIELENQYINISFDSYLETVVNLGLGKIWGF